MKMKLYKSSVGSFIILTDVFIQKKKFRHTHRLPNREKMERSVYKPKMSKIASKTPAVEKKHGTDRFSGTTNPATTFILDF
jgi:hypothetical protein